MVDESLVSGVLVPRFEWPPLWLKFEGKPNFHWYNASNFDLWQFKTLVCLAYLYY